MKAGASVGLCHPLKRPVLRPRPAVPHLSQKAINRTRAALRELRRWCDFRRNPSRKDFLRELDRHLSALGTGKVAVIGHPPFALSAWINRAHPRLHVVSVEASQPASELHACLSADGPFRVAVDDTRAVRGRARRFRNVFFHLEAGGAFVVSSPALRARGKEDVRHVVARGGGSGSGGPRGADRRRDDARLAASIKGVVSTRHHLVVINELPALAKMREHEMNTVLSLRNASSGAVLHRRPGLSFASRCNLRQSPSHIDHRLPAIYQAPDMWLREYRDVVCVPGQVLIQGNLLLPDSYRHNQQSRLTNHVTREVAPRFARLAEDVREAKPMPGTYFHLDSEWQGHFGHAMTEVMSRLWAWQEAKERAPGLKALLSVSHGAAQITDFHRDILGSCGIDAVDVELIDAPVRVDRLISATPMYSMPDYVHPAIRDMWAWVGARLVDTAPARSRADRLFCARRHGKRRCRNSEQVESYFSSHGFQRIYPEDFPLSEQAAMFRHADIVAGYAGSAMFTLALCSEPKHAILVSSESYRAQNEYMISSVVGHRLDIAWCTPHATPGVNGRTRPRFNSDFSFNFRREGLFLDEVLKSL
jgi:capsular polysaccharide biosynthesis protein